MDPYKDILVITTLKKNQEETELELNLPFQLYGQNIVMNGEDITYNLNDLSNEGAEVLAKVTYCTVERPGTRIKDESVVAEAFAGNMGNDWSKIKKDVRYAKHYNVKKEDALATTDNKGVVTKYNGADKLDLVKFTQWEEEKVEVLVEI